MTDASDVRDLVELDPDHPGFKDPEYRARRDLIARIALDYTAGEDVPVAPYSAEEHDVWRQILALLRPQHEEHVCEPILVMQRKLPLPRYQIPQLAFVNERLSPRSGMRMEPVMGLVKVRTFLTLLAQGIFPSTQYIRHHSRPHYTPEPDVVHELIGHMASLAHRGIAEANKCMGRAALAASETELARLEHVYWYVLEFGLCEQNGKLKAVGAGLLSSSGELAAIEDGPELRGWDLDVIAQTPYDPTRMQPHLFVAPSFDRLLGDLVTWVGQGSWRDSPAPLASRASIVYPSAP
ncbi:MAG: phenylalanine 4-monooxygenase [Deltaproteobacteria bacterium]|nr:phenylalanine 4-monooxygenase [Deltaproteobacteria bacterium]